MYIYSVNIFYIHTYICMHALAYVTSSKWFLLFKCQENCSAPSCVCVCVHNGLVSAKQLHIPSALSEFLFAYQFVVVPFSFCLFTKQMVEKLRKVGLYRSENAAEADIGIGHSVLLMHKQLSQGDRLVCLFYIVVSLSTRLVVKRTVFSP